MATSHCDRGGEKHSNIVRLFSVSLSLPTGSGGTENLAAPTAVAAVETGGAVAKILASGAVVALHVADRPECTHCSPCSA